MGLDASLRVRSGVQGMENDDGAHDDFMQSRESRGMGAQSDTRHVEERKEGRSERSC
jgi:hypothetical protein